MSNLRSHCDLAIRFKRAMLMRCLPAHAAPDSALRSTLVAKWGFENFVVHGRASQAEFGPAIHPLSIRAVWGGSEHCELGGRTVAVDDDNFLIVNNGRFYATRIDSNEAVESFWICFRPGLVEHAYGAMTASIEQALGDGHAIAERTTEFEEHLQPHDSGVSPVLRFIKSHLRQGVDDEQWYEEQLLFLLERMLAHREQTRHCIDKLPFIRASTRREIYRRICLATDFLHSSYALSFDLEEVARSAYLSKYHFLRLFTRIHGLTPFNYLQRKRTAVALRLLQSTQMPIEEIASTVGLGHRQTLARQIERWTGYTPLEIRALAREGKRIKRPGLARTTPAPRALAAT